MSDGETLRILSDISQKFGAIQTSQAAQAKQLGDLNTKFDDVQNSLKDGAVKMERTATVVESHINDPNIHLTTEIVEKEINEELMKRGIPVGIRIDRAWAREHWKGLGGLITLVGIILGALGLTGGA